MKNNHLTGFEVAVIGMAGRFPGANNLKEFWENLKNGTESVLFLDSEELEGIESTIKDNPNYVNSKGGKISGSGYFDDEFFGYTPIEAELMDPQMRLMHECAWEALEDAGYDSLCFKGDIGVYSGASENFHWEAASYINEKDKATGSIMSHLLRDKDHISTRLAYKLNLKGQSVIVSTACSTSLYAIHLAARSILTGENDMALAGGVSIQTRKSNGYIYQEGAIQSKDGHCRPFDAEATGTVSGEGVGFVLLKSYDRALEDKDHIYAVIKGSAANNDGYNKIGFTAPSVQGQSKVISSAHHMAEIKSDSVTYVEAHGTGTELGDPTEINALTDAFKTEKTNFCAIGSVKSNIGHLDAAAGVAGFIKTVLSIKNKQIPQSINYNRPNPKIEFEKTPFYVNTELQDWQNENYPLRAGVSSFGIGGTNVHMVIEEDLCSEQTSNSEKVKLLLFSANSKKQLNELVKNNMDYLLNNSEVCLDDVAYTLKVGRRSHKFKKTILASNTGEAAEIYKTNNPKYTKSFVSESKDKPLCFMFPGVGSHYQNMAWDLYKNESIYKKYVDGCIQEINKWIDYDFKDCLFSENGTAESDQIDDFEKGQLLTFTVEYSLAKLFMDWGIKPDYLVGYSFGELSAACISGVFDLSTVVWLIIERARLIKQLHKSKMLSVPLSIDDVKIEISSELMVAIDNGTSSIIVGDEAEVDKLNEKLRSKRLLCMEVNNQYPIHSNLVAPIVKDFKLLLSQVKFKKPEIKLVSNVTGTWIDDETLASADYWINHLENTVMFSSCINELLKVNDIILLEVGPGRSLGNLVMQNQNRGLTQFVVNTLPTETENINSDLHLQSKIGQLWLYGYEVDWNKIHRNDEFNRISLPTYPFKKNEFEYVVDLSTIASRTDNNVSEQNLNRKPIDEWYYTSTWNRKPLFNETSPKKGGVCILIANDHILNSGILDSLSVIHQKVILIIEENTNFSSNNDIYAIDIQNTDCYQNVFTKIASQSIIPDVIYHCLTYNIENADNITAIHERGIFNVLNLVKTITKLKVETVKLNIISNKFYDVLGGEEVVSLKSTLYGAIKVIQQEFTFIQTKIIDINLFSELYDKQILTSIFRAEYDNEHVENNVAYRNNYRWVKDYNTVKLNNKADIKLHRGGCYLITGGTGNIGLTLTKYLTTSWDAKVILFSRTDLPKRNQWDNCLNDSSIDKQVKYKITELKNIVDAGGQVLIVKCDVCKVDEVNSAMSTVLKKYKKINGVIHAAGVTRGRSLVCDINSITNSELKEQFAPKIQGLMNMTEAVRNKGLDFFLSVSSLSPILGGLGFYAYAAANSFLDFYTTKQNGISSTKWVVVNWADWKFGSESQRYSTNEELSISAEEGVQNFQHILSNLGIEQIIISAVSLKQRIEKWVNLSELRQESTSDLVSEPEKHPRPELLSEYVEPTCKLEETIERIWTNLFGYHKIGVYDNFFELGGDSLKALVLLSNVFKQTGVNIAVKEFFINPTIKGVAALISVNKQSITKAFPNVEKKEYYMVSSPQQTIYVNEELFKNTSVYNEPRFLELPGNVSISKLKDCIQEVIKRHESLRTRFTTINSQLVQIVEENVNFNIKEIQCKEEDLNIHIHNFVTPFDLNVAPLFKSEIINLDKEKVILLVDLHHIIADGISHEIFWNELFRLYNDEILEPCSLQYKDFAHWSLNEQYNNESEKFWSEELNDLPKPIDLPIDNERNNESSQGAGVHTFTINNKESITKLLQSKNVTLYTFMLSGFYTLLSKLTGQYDIIIGAVSNGRHQEFLNNTIGMFVNTLPFRISGSEKITFIELLNNIMQKSINVFDNQYYNIDGLLRKLDKSKETGRNPLFNVLVTAESNIGGVKSQGQSRLSIKSIDGNHSRFDLVLIYSEFEDSIELNFKYNSSIFEKSTIEKISEYFKLLIEQITSNPSVAIKQIDLLSNEFNKRLLKPSLVDSGSNEQVDSGLDEDSVEFNMD